MTARSVNGSGSVARSGARALLLLAIPLNGRILEALSDSPKRLTDLRRECGSPAQSTLRAHLRELEDVAAVAKRQRSDFPGAVECELTKAGEDLIFVRTAVERWLRAAPDGGLELGDPAAKASIKALVEAWSSSMLRALAARPLSLTELDGIIDSLSYPALERRLAAMRLAGQVRACQSDGAGTPYAVTRWLRQGTGPLAAAVRWERRHLAGETPAIAPADTETGFLLALPLTKLPAELSGSCRLGVETTNGSERRLAGAVARVEEGRVRSCTVRLNQSADAWAIGPVNAWLHAIIGADPDGLELGGDQQLARALLDGIHAALFGGRVRA